MAGKGQGLYFAMNSKRIFCMATPQGIPLYEDLKIKPGEKEQLIFDPVRKKWLVLTPEEHVRQCLIRYLTAEKHYPLGLISVERGLEYNRTARRYDLLVYNRDGGALVMIECKAPDIPLDRKTLMQASVYNSKIGAPNLLVVNGPQAYFFRKAGEGWELEAGIPEFESLLGGG